MCSAQRMHSGVELGLRCTPGRRMFSTRRRLHNGSLNDEREADACLHTKVEEEVPVHESVVNREEVRMRRLSRALPQSNVVKAIRYYLRGLRDLAGTHRVTATRGRVCVT